MKGARRGGALVWMIGIGLVGCGSPPRARRQDPPPRAARVPVDPSLRPTCRDQTFRDENHAVETPAPPSPSVCPPGMAPLPAGTLFSKRVGEIRVAAFCLDLTEVTVADYAGCVLDRKCSTENVGSVFWNGQDQGAGACNYGVTGRGQHPMNCVDWSTADNFCRARGKRLPSELEWEWAAIGGDENRYHPWGQEERDGRGCWLDDLNEPRRNSLPSGGESSTHSPRPSTTVREAARSMVLPGAVNSTCEVGSFPTGNARFGHRDLAGNVWEWTNTLLDAPCQERIIRGGHQAEPPTFRSSALGFRCAL